MPFFDAAVASQTDLMHALREEAGALQDAVSDRLGAFVQGLACFAGGMVRRMNGAGRAGPCVGGM